MIEAHTLSLYDWEYRDVISTKQKYPMPLPLSYLYHFGSSFFWTPDSWIPTECKPWATHPQTRQSSEDSNECWWGVLLMVIRRWLLVIGIQDSASFWAPEVTNYPGCICREIAMSVRSSVTCRVSHKPSSNPESSVDKVLVLFTILLSGKWFGVYSHLLLCW